MKHYEDQDWVAFVFGEAKPEARRRLSAHLAECPECAAEIAGWGSSLKRLDHWTLDRPPRRARPFAPALQWAMAVLLVLAAGIGIGRWCAPAPLDPQKLRAEVERSVRAALAGDLAEGLAAAQERLAQESQAELNQFWGEMVETMQTTRQADQQALYTFLRRMEQRQDSALVALRKDLETVATLTDDEIRLARLRWLQLAGYTEPPADPKPSP